MRSERSETRKAYAAFRVRGDALEPSRITKIMRFVPTIAYAKGESFHAGERSGERIGRTGLWLLSTDGVVASDNLHHHLAYILGMLAPGRQDMRPLTDLHGLLLRQKGLRADLTCFWHGRRGARVPSIPRAVSETMKLIPADIEVDFDTDADERRSA